MMEDTTVPVDLIDHAQRLIELCKKPWQDNDESKNMNRELDNLLLQQNIDVNAIDKDGRSPLNYAAQLARVHIMDQLIKLGANVHYQENKRGFTSLHFTILSGTVTTAVELLLSAGADVNAEAHFGVTPLHIASIIGPIDILELLIERGADVTRREGIFKFTPLLIATYHGSGKIVDSLIQRGADVNASNDVGLTPLHLASMLGDVNIVKTLIRGGANVNCRHKITKLTPLHLASTNGTSDAVNDFIEIGQGLSNIGSSVITETMAFCAISMDGRRAVVDMLIKNGADLQARDRSGKTALHLATRHRSNVIECLLKAGADVDARDYDDRVPLHEAIKNKNGEGLGLLLNYGADLNDVIEYCEPRLNSTKLYDYVVYQLLEHLTKMIAAKLMIARVFKRYISEYGLKLYYDECVKEVEKMKSRKLGNGVTLYSLLHMDPMRRLSFIKNIPVDFDSKFPVYCGIIRASFLEFSRRKPLVEPAKVAWNRLTGINWPDLCVGCLFKYFDNAMLKMVVKAGDVRFVVKKEPQVENSIATLAI